MLSLICPDTGNIPLKKTARKTGIVMCFHMKGIMRNMALTYFHLAIV